MLQGLLIVIEEFLPLDCSLADTLNEDVAVGIPEVVSHPRLRSFGSPRTAAYHRLHTAEHDAPCAVLKGTVREWEVHSGIELGKVVERAETFWILRMRR